MVNNTGYSQMPGLRVRLACYTRDKHSDQVTAFTVLVFQTDVHRNVYHGTIVTHSL